MGKLVYDGKSVYEIDEDCLQEKGRTGTAEGDGVAEKRI